MLNEAESLNIDSVLRGENEDLQGECVLSDAIINPKLNQIKHFKQNNKYLKKNALLLNRNTVVSKAPLTSK